MRKWTKEEDQFLKENWLSVSNELLSHSLQRSVNAIQQRALKKRLPHKPRRNAISKELIDYIEKHAGKLTGREIAAKLKMKEATVYRVAYYNGIKFLRGRKNV